MEPIDLGLLKAIPRSPRFDDVVDGLLRSVVLAFVVLGTVLLTASVV
jgi:hypothetical protein